MKLTSIITLAFTSLVLMSCEGNTRREFKILNNSSSTIHHSSTGYVNDSFNISSGTLKTIGITDDLGGNKNPLSPSELLFDFIIHNGSDTTTKDYTIDENWLITSQRVKGTPSHYTHDYVFIIEDEDF